MFRAILICGDADCAETFEAYGSLEELEALACDCGCTLEVLEIGAADDAAPAAATPGFVLAPLR